MRTPDAANLPRWRGQAGFFEIWFLVVFDPGASRAWWFRYTTFAPAAGRPDGPRASLWAAAFAAGTEAIASKAVLPISAYHPGDPETFGVRVGDAELTRDRCRGRVESGGHVIEWSLAYTPARHEAQRGPTVLAHLPLPTHVAHANSEVAFTGWVAVDGVRHDLRGAPGTQKHLWGTRRVEELYWCYCPRFDGDVIAAFETTAVRARRQLPGGIGAPLLTSAWVRTRDGEHGWWGPGELLANRVEVVRPDEVRIVAGSTTRAARAVVRCDPRTLAGYVYRDPAGWDVHVAQSDVASLTVELLVRRHVLAEWRLASRLTARAAAAIEFHRPEPLPGVRYVPWDAAAPGDPARPSL